jgi:tripartite-type tricarboxylate transporter receptor subunit TctC
VVTRLVAQKFADNLKANVVIQNSGGGGGVPAAIAFKQATPDGYTLFLANNGLFAIMPAMTAEIRFDPIKDFQPVTPLFAFPSVLVVPSGSPARSAEELVALAKSKPTGLNYASQGVGSGGHILAEMLRLNSGAPLVHVPYRGAGPAVVDLAAGNIDLLFSSYVSAIGQVQGGKLKVLGWTSTKRTPALPDVPTMAEAGLPQLEGGPWFGLLVPAGTPRAVVDWLNSEARKAFEAPDVRERLAAQNLTLPLGTPEDFAAHIAAETKRWGDVIRAAGIKME